jgi:kinetochore protein NDC80
VRVPPVLGECELIHCPLASNLEQLKVEQERLSEVVKEQNISPEEVVRMNTEHEQLSRNLGDLKVKIAESQKNVLSLEVAVANRGAAAEEAVDAYTRLLSNLGLFPPLPPPLQDIDLQVELNTAASQTESLLKGPDVRHVIKPTLNALIEGKRGERAAVESERIKVDHELDQLISVCENLEDEINETEKKVMVLNEQADDLREVSRFPFQIDAIRCLTWHIIVATGCTARGPRKQRRDSPP